MEYAYELERESNLNHIHTIFEQDGIYEDQKNLWPIKSMESMENNLNTNQKNWWNIPKKHQKKQQSRHFRWSHLGWSFGDMNPYGGDNLGVSSLAQPGLYGSKLRVTKSDCKKHIFQTKLKWYFTNLYQPRFPWNVFWKLYPSQIYSSM